MKKLLLVLAFVSVASFTVTSCKKDKKEETKTEEVKSEEKKERASNELYQCPMDCEKGKSYTEAGVCPKCEMDLKTKKVDMDGDKTAETCKKCPEGKCVCKKDAAKTAEACAKHPDGKCACKTKSA